jgi:hypothetical protein
MRLGCEIPQGRVPPLTMVETFDEGEDRAARLPMSLEGLSIQQLALQGGKQALG